MLPVALLWGSTFSKQVWEYMEFRATTLPAWEILGKPGAGNIPAAWLGAVSEPETAAHSTGSWQPAPTHYYRPWTLAYTTPSLFSELSDANPYSFSHHALASQLLGVLRVRLTVAGKQNTDCSEMSRSVNSTSFSNSGKCSISISTCSRQM